MRTKVNNVNKRQTVFIEDPQFPSTRFQGSKLKIVDWIWDAVKSLDFETALDAFGGTGSVGYMLKTKGKQVTFNDIMKFNWFIGTALIQNDNVTLSDEDIESILQRHKEREYPTFVYDTFKDIYFTDEENEWIDKVVTNIEFIDDFYKKAIAYFALFQACIIKRPYNLFHRKNLYIRLADVERNFGNKATWDTPFEMHFRQFVAEANQAVFDNGHENKALNVDALNVSGKFDLVYIDTPYISHKGVGVDYHHFYHFLEGLVNYNLWPTMINYRNKHKSLKTKKSVWADKLKITKAFMQLFEKFPNSIIVVSYRADGIPSIRELVDMLKYFKTDVQEYDRTSYKYALSTNDSAEVLLIGK